MKGAGSRRGVPDLLRRPRIRASSAHGVAAALAVLIAAASVGGPGALAAAKKKPDAAAASAAPAKKPAAGVPLLPGSGSKEPVNIEADKLDYLNKEQQLIYTGNVVVVQGDSTLKASVLTIDLQKNDPGAGGATAPAVPGAANAPPAAAMGPGQGTSVRHMVAEGPVTLISKDQVGTGDQATYDKAENRVYLNGNVTLSQGTNVTQGDRLVYDMTSGQAQVFSGETNGGRVSSVFTPGSAPPGDTKSAPPGGIKPAPAARPAPAKRNTAAAAKTPRGEAAAVREDVTP